MVEIKNLVANFDQFSEDKNRPRTFPGGVIAIIGYLLVIFYLAFYIAVSIYGEYPTNSRVNAFPITSSDTLYMPPMTCVDPSGCYISPQRSTIADPKDSDQCIYLPEGAQLPREFRGLVYNSDPIEAFQVISTTSSNNFALSYDVTTVSKYTIPLETTTIPAQPNTNPGTPISYKLYRGISIMNLVETTTESDGDSVETWLNTITTEQSQFTGSGGCCDMSVYDVDGALLPDKTNIMKNCGSNFDQWWSTKIMAPTTYSTIEVVNPVGVILILALIGGWVSVMHLVGLGVFTFSKFCDAPTDVVSQKSVEVPVDASEDL